MLTRKFSCPIPIRSLTAPSGHQEQPAAIRSQAPSRQPGRGSLRPRQHPPPSSTQHQAEPNTRQQAVLDKKCPRCPIPIRSLTAPSGHQEKPAAIRSQAPYRQPGRGSLRPRQHPPPSSTQHQAEPNTRQQAVLDKKCPRCPIPIRSLTAPSGHQEQPAASSRQEPAGQPGRGSLRTRQHSQPGSTHNQAARKTRHQAALDTNCPRCPIPIRSLTAPSGHQEQPAASSRQEPAGQPGRESLRPRQHPPPSSTRHQAAHKVQNTIRQHELKMNHR